MRMLQSSFSWHVCINHNQLLPLTKQLDIRMYLQKALLYSGCKLFASSLHTLCDSLWQPFLDEPNVLISFVALISLGMGTEKSNLLPMYTQTT